MTTHEPWDVRDPAAVIADVLQRCPAEPGDVLVARLTRADASEQSVLDATRVLRGKKPSRHDASELVRRHAEKLVGPRPWQGDGWRPPQSVLVTVVCRNGRVVPGPEETFWMLAWRYANHHRDAFDGDVYLVTEHGWTGYLDRRAAFTPALAPVSGQRGVVDGARARPRLRSV